MTKKFIVLSMSTASLLAPGAALAQDEGIPANTGVNEIIVTAQRREQTLTSVPLSITAVTGENLTSKGLEQVSDLKFQTPGFIAQQGTGYTQIFIRGVGNNIFVGADPSVAQFVDDVPRVYGSIVDSFVNVARVEVLKGAQGGLYGRNATGGVINIITQQPNDDEWKLVGKFSAGEYKFLEASAYVNLPIAEGVAMNISGQRKVRDPFHKNIAVPNPYPAGTTSFFGDPNAPIEVTPLNNQDFYALDAKLRLDLTENLAVTFGADYSDKHDANGNGWVQLDHAKNYQVYLGYAAAAGISNPLPPWRPAEFGKEVYGAIDSFSYTEDYGFSGIIDLALAGVDLKSITAFRWNNSNFRGDIGQAPVPMAGFFTDFDRSNFYQELRFVSNGSGPLRFLGGASYYTDDIDNSLQGLFVGFPASLTLSQTETKNWSVYGELSYDLTDRLTLTSSLRYVTEKKSAFFPAGGGAVGGQAEESSSTKQSKVLPSANISYKMGDGVVYARYARGFKTGGVNPIVRPSAFQGQPGSTFAGEVVDSFEVGYRANLFDRRVQLTTAAFYNAFDGVQGVLSGNAANPTLSNAIINFGKARTYGAEAAVTWQLIPTLTVSANLGYLNARYKQGAGYVGSPVVDPVDASGNRMALSPKWQGGASVSLDQPVSDAFRIKATALYSHVGHFNYQYQELPLLEQSSYDVVNVRAGVATIDDDIGIYIFANNVFDEFYSFFGSTGSLGTYQTPAAPRLIGATLEFNF